MDEMDLSFILLTKKLNEIKTEKNNKLVYVYDIKAQDIQSKNWIMLNRVNESVEWLNIGGTYIKKMAQISIDVKTTNKKDYGILKSELRKIFDGKTLNYYKKDNSDIQYDGNVNISGSFLRVCNDADNILFEGQYIYLSQLDEYGWIVWKDINNDVYIFTGMGQYFLSKPVNITDLSIELKGIYRFNMDVEWQVIQRQIE